ncbi:hypothetical protein AQJ46_28145 [Streptomyces canus]|uniref:Uncharacterized protein n=1 Tax=Streptomyces canus TaxID=58343 RepID=A0A101S036_9ACTN|nr:MULTISPECIES: DUF5819 family protein [Streptomyces]KUN64987.1 hypothetical protein AQJ46_28145 [Streptomyces canus]MDI5909300.1 DUF5819 family protein [Streptomyces sp. 12257]
MDAYDGGSNARRQPGAPSEPGDAPEPEGPDGPETTQAPGEPAALSQPQEEFPAPDRQPADPAEIRRPAAPPAPYGDPHLPTGVAALSLRYQIGVALALAVVAVAVCVHIGMVFLHVAPQNTVTKQHGRAVDDWVYPEFEQNWKLFAPNPLQVNIAVQVRARIRSADGGSRTTGWYDLSAQDGRAIDGNLLPSHTQQNELRRSWDLFVATHDADNRPVGLRGTLSETYLRRIVVLRLERDDATAPGDVLVSVQVRSRTTNVPPPKWSEEKVSVQPVYRELPWWAVTADDTEGSVR